MSALAEAWPFLLAVFLLGVLTGITWTVWQELQEAEAVLAALEKLE